MTSRIGVITFPGTLDDVDAVRAVGTGAMVTFRTEITDRQGQPVSTARSSLLVRGDDQ